MKWAGIFATALVLPSSPPSGSYSGNIVYDSDLSSRDLKAVARLLSDTFDSVNFLFKWYSVLDYEAQLQQRVDRIINRLG